MKSLSYLNTFSGDSVPYNDQGLGIQTLADRYQINGLIDTTRPVMENIEKICSAAGSWLSYDIHEGKWGVVVNEAGTPVVNFNDSNIIGNINIGGTGLSDLYNSVKIEFPHRDLRDSADYVTISIPSGDRNANEEDNTLNLSYDIINEPIQAQILGLIELKQSRVDLVINFEADFSYINLKAGDIISVTNSRLGFLEKLFRIISMNEIQDDDGALKIGITALEYKSDIYTLSDLYRYTRSDSNGIITIGSIGVPGTPQVTKYESDARPRIEIISTAPTGVVEGLEFWITEDYLLQEPSRSYKLIASIKPPGGGVFTSGTPVTFDYDNINTGNFLVKTRGFNATTFGSFSDPSGLIVFTSTQVTNAIGPETKTVNAAGQIVTLIGTQLLLKSIDGLFSGDTNSTSSIFKKIFDLLQQTTGVNLLGTVIPVVNSVSPSSGPITGGTAVTIIGNNFTSATNVTFSGTTATGITVVNSATITCTTPARSAGAASVVVTTPSGSNSGNALFTYVSTTTPILLPTITSINPSSGPPEGATEITITGTRLSDTTEVRFGSNPATNVINVNSTTVTAVTPAGAVGAVNVTLTTPEGTALKSNGFTYLGLSETLVIDTKLPPDRNTYQEPLDDNVYSSDKAPVNGSYFIRYRKQNNQPFYGQLGPGPSGTVKLYKSDGTLVQQLTPAQLLFLNNRVELPFNTREFGTDYYILMDQGVVRYCSADSPVINQPTVWNFNTPSTSTAVYTMSTTAPSSFGGAPSVTGTSVSCFDLTLSFSVPIIKGTGSFSILSTSDVFIRTISLTSATVAGNNLTIPNMNTLLTPGTSYKIQAPAGIVKSYVTQDCFISSTSSAIISAQNFTLPVALALSSFNVKSNPYEPDNEFQYVNPQTNIELIFNKSIQFTNTGTITIYESNGTVHQAIPVNTSFENNKTSELIWIEPTTNTLWINPTKDFTRGKTYYVLATPTCVRSTCNEEWTGISDSNTVRFTIDSGPRFTTTTVGTDTSDIVYDFGREITPSTGTLQIYDNNDVLLAEYPSTSTFFTYF